MIHHPLGNRMCNNQVEWKSIQACLWNDILSSFLTLKYYTRTEAKCLITKQKWFQFRHVYSSFSLTFNHFSILLKPRGNCYYVHPICPFLSFPKKEHSRFHIMNNQRMNGNQSSILSIARSSSNRSDDFD